MFRGKKIVWSEKSLARFKRRVKELTGRGWGVAMDYRLQKLSEFIRGWMAYFALSEYAQPRAGPGRMDTPPRADVLLETVATLPQTGARTPETRGLQGMGHSGGPQPEELLAPLPHDGNAVGHERRMAGITGPGLGAKLVDRFSLPGSESVRVTRPDGETF